MRDFVNTCENTPLAKRIFEACARCKLTEPACASRTSNLAGDVEDVVFA